MTSMVLILIAYALPFWAFWAFVQASDRQVEKERLRAREEGRLSDWVYGSIPSDSDISL